MLYTINESQKTEEKGHILKKNYCKNDPQTFLAARCKPMRV